jgi:phosphoadenosine phosphosulfate reductase
MEKNQPLKERYRLRAKLGVYRKRMDEARGLIIQAASIAKPHVAFSGGKDSLALFHLASSVIPGIAGAFIDSGAESPDTHSVIAEMRGRGYPIETVYPKLSVIDMFKMVGELGYDGPDKLPGEWHWTVAKYQDVLINEPSRRYCAEHDSPVVLLGLRKQENRARRMALNKFGPIHQLQDGVWHVNPLYRWDAEDVFAYCLANDLPLSDLYLDPDIDSTERHRRRTGNTLCERGLEDFSRYKRTHPAFWQELLRTFPHLSRLC